MTALQELQLARVEMGKVQEMLESSPEKKEPESEEKVEHIDYYILLHGCFQIFSVFCKKG